ncbi:ABC transporter permease [Roseburia sp. MUC/MUC-530-WT-4D]|uniref:ABC transporter permease n=1 Tax=Roseburia porci TaxID=2605790 RepID=A0A6L5YQN1_9FIRM|nr:ABC transporter permease [Roseburia porci]MCI5517225.1 ABC transporter permease [Roseburia sp.]MDD6742605.1 ABC transporter permease [Roseburia porci]MST74720.1 ABC transporter permease [Roseburia porci]
MNLFECIRLALDSIKANKLRSVLTMLGIIIGISSVITITTIGNSLQKTISSTLTSLGGTNLITAYVNAVIPDDVDYDTWEYPDMTTDDMLQYEDLMAYKEAFGDKVKSVIANIGLGSGTVDGEETVNVNTMGTTPGMLDANKLTLIEGRDISEKDNEQEKATAVVSDLFVKYACDGNSPIGKQISISLSDGSVLKVYVVGVYQYDKVKLGGGNTKVAEKDISTPVYIPFTYAADQVDDPAMAAIQYFNVLAGEGTDPTQLAQDTTSYFAEHKYKEDTAWEVQCHDMASELGVINTVLKVITIAISVIAAISLIVGGVGVMNIMLVSVVERTREIGIRKALGAKNRGIHLQFLTESVVICLIGGIIGILLGIFNGFLLSKVAVMLIKNFASDIGSMLTVSVSPSLTAIIVSVIFSMLTGIVFGSYPAKRAARMSPIDALRYE